MNSTAVAGSLTEDGAHQPQLDLGTSAFMFMATALVQFMTPGLGLFYAGMVGARSTVQLLFQSWICMGVIVCVWNVCGFSMSFGEPWISLNGYHILGNPTTYFFLKGVPISEPLRRGDTTIGEGFPGLLFAAFLGMFAVIAPALLSGAVVERMRFPVFRLLAIMWLLVVYAPVGYWNWGGGWMMQLGAWDFAGGLVVHETAGFSALGMLLILGNRATPPSNGTSSNKGSANNTPRSGAMVTIDANGQQSFGAESFPHNVPLTLLGTSMLWFGWFGFNCGSALSSGRLLAVSFMNTLNAPATAMVTWVAFDRFIKGKPSLVGACSGVVAGLVAITPAAGYVQPQAGLLIGVLATLVCYPCTILVRQKAKLDDACDAVGIHGAGGFLGSVLVGALADDKHCLDVSTADEWCVNPGTVARSLEQMGIQACCGIFVAIYSFAMSILIMKVIFAFTLKLETYTTQQLAYDGASFTERAYRHLTGPILPIPAGPPSVMDDDASTHCDSPDSRHTSGSTRALLVTQQELRRKPLGPIEP